MLAEKETSAESKSDIAKPEDKGRPADRLKTALVKGRSETLAADLNEALAEYGNAVSIIEGPLMEGMETVGKMFGAGKMFLPQVVKSAKVMRDAVEILQPYMNDSQSDNEQRQSRPKIVIATVKGDVHDIGKNITGIVLTCNGFDIHDLGVMVDKETILKAAEDDKADIIAVSGLITPSLYQMEEICREMSARNMTTPLFIGGATTSAEHTAKKLAPYYNAPVLWTSDATQLVLLAKKLYAEGENNDGKYSDYVVELMQQQGALTKQEKEPTQSLDTLENSRKSSVNLYTD